MNISREEKKAEAVRRMEELGIIEQVIDEFRQNDVVEVSEPPFGGLYYLDDEQKTLLAKVEEEYNCLVFLVVRCYTTIGTMDSFLFISDYEEDWLYDWENIKEDIVFTYTHNYGAPECSELGSIAVKRVGGGLVRIG